MSAREILEQLSRLTLAELREVGQRVDELTHSAITGLRVERSGGRLVLAGARVIRQSEVEAILDELP